MMATKLRFGVVGAGAGRGGPDQLLAQMRDELPALGAAVSALCDPDKVALTAAAATVGLEPTEHCFTDYIAMLDSGLVDAVLIATPMEFHAAQTIEALERNIHVLCEVTAAVSVAECRAVVEAASCSDAHYAMAENYMYARYTQFVAKLIEDGRLGEPHYAEGEYLSHGAYPSTVWRRKWMVGRKGITYGTHPLAPILVWYGLHDRITRVSCSDSGSNYSDELGQPYASDGAVMMAKTEKGRLIKIRLDLVSASPGGSRHVLQATGGKFEQESGGVARVSFLGKDGRPGPWHPLADIMREEEPESSLRSFNLRQMLADFVAGCHQRSAGARLEQDDQIGGLLGDVHRAMDLTLPGLLSEVSAEEESRWVEVPDSRDWVRSRLPQAGSSRM